jgi:hypothetical protein
MKKKREEVVVKKRIQSVIFCLHEFNNQLVDDYSNKDSFIKKQKQVDIITNALQANNLDCALNILSPWFTTGDDKNNKKTTKQNKNKEKKEQLEISTKEVQGSIIKNICKGLGFLNFFIFK